MRTEGAASGQPAETSDPVLNKTTTAIGGKAESQAIDQSSETSDPVLKKAKTVLAAKMEDPASVEIVDIKRATNKNTFGQSFEIICGRVKGKMKSGEATGERPFLYLVKEDEAFIVGGNPDSMAAIVYRAQCCQREFALTESHDKRTILVSCQCPLLGVNRTWLFAVHMSAYDPKRTL